VAVPLPDVVLELVIVLLDVDLEVVDAVAVCTAGVCGWNAKTPAVPATVVAITIGYLRIKVLRREGGASDGELRRDRSESPERRLRGS
jgi:hypothetical protein